MFKNISSSLTVYFCPFFSLFFFHRFFFTHFFLFSTHFFLFFLSFVICLVSDTYLVSDARAFPGRPGRPAIYALDFSGFGFVLTNSEALYPTDSLNFPALLIYPVYCV